MYLLIGKSNVITRGPGLTSSNKALYVPYFFYVYFTGFFVLDELGSLFVYLDGFFVVQPKGTVVIDHEIREAQGFVIGHRYISGSLVGHVYFMALVLQAYERTSHTNDIIIRVRTKNKYALFGRICPFRSIAIIGVGLSSGPTGNGVL